MVAITCKMEILKKILAFPLSVLAHLLFFICIVVFHGIQWLCLKLGGYEAHKKSVDVFNFFLMRCVNVLGSRFSFENFYSIPTDAPIIFVSNHQGMYDIPPIIWFLRDHHPKFVSKKELGKGIPGISFNLKYGGSVLIDRKNNRESLLKLSKFADYLNQTKRSAVIFPEGTRSKAGKPKRFATNGMQILFKKMPTAYVVPLTINNSWKLFRNGLFPLDLGVHFKLKVHKPIPVKAETPENLARQVEAIIIADII